MKIILFVCTIFPPDLKRGSWTENSTEHAQVLATFLATVWLLQLLPQMLPELLPLPATNYIFILGRVVYKITYDQVAIPAADYLSLGSQDTTTD